VKKKVIQAEKDEQLDTPLTKKEKDTQNTHLIIFELNEVLML
jgi:hypothetical protein